MNTYANAYLVDHHHVSATIIASLYGMNPTTAWRRPLGFAAALVISSGGALCWIILKHKDVVTYLGCAMRTPHYLICPEANLPASDNFH
jgi:hypothetical protein